MSGAFSAAAFDEYAFDVDYTSSSALFLSVDGTQRATGRSDENAKVLYGSLTVVDIINETPNTCTFRAKGFTPEVGQRVIVALGGVTNPSRLFAGTILTCKQSHVGSPENAIFDVSCADDTWKLGQVKVTIRYLSMSATDIAIDLIDTYAPDFDTTDIEAGLDDIDEITFTNETLSTCLTRLAQRIGGYWYVDEFESIHFFVTDTATDPAELNDSNPPLATSTKPLFSVDRDISQVVTRVLGEGGGGVSISEVPAGETILPVSEPDWFNSGGGTVVSGPQRINYTGVDEGGGGGLVGPGASPSAMLTVTGEWGTALDNNAAYDYAYTFVTGAGETLPSPHTSFTTGSGAPSPTAHPGLTAVNTGPPNNFGSGGTVYYGLSYEFPGTLRTAIGSITPVLAGAATEYIAITTIQQPTDSEATGINIWRSTVNGYTGIASLKLVTTIGIGTTSYNDSTQDGSLGVGAHTSPTAVCREARITNIPAGQAGVVTGRKLYRTEGGLSQLKLLHTFADNTTDEFEDDVADGSLGANAPVADTSGLTQEEGIVPAGSTELPVAGGSFPDEGWAVVGNQVIRYTGRSASELTGIPPTGVGALSAPVSYNVSCVAAAQLTGIEPSGDGSILYDIAKGDDVNLFIVEDDLAAQAELAAAIGSGTGIVEEFLQDRRRTETEMRERAVAILAQRSPITASIGYAIGGKTDPGCRDHRSGRTIAIDLPDMNVNDSYKIQRVRISNFEPALEPVFSVEASTTRFSFENILRQGRSNNGSSP